MRNSVGFILLILIMISSAAMLCRKREGKTGVVIRVERIDGTNLKKLVIGAVVHLYCDSAINPGCNIDETKTTGESGQTSHTLSHPAVLFTDAKFDTLYGKTTVHLIEGEIVNKTILIE